MENEAAIADLSEWMEAACTRIGACFTRVQEASPAVREAVLREHGFIFELIRGFGRGGDSLKPLVALAEQSAQLMEGCLAQTFSRQPTEDNMPSLTES